MHEVSSSNPRATQRKKIVKPKEKNEIGTSMMAQACDSSTQEAEVGGSRV
jgi:hypothetical protein